MQLEGSCHCGSVRFTVRCPHPYPFNRCYCSICRKTAGGGGYAINIGGEHHSLKVEGVESVSAYQARIRNPQTGHFEQSPGRRHFCKHCGSALWVWDPRWPELVHPFASAIDTELPVPPEHTHMMLGSKAGWVEVDAGPEDRCFDEYPDESLAEWHRRLGLGDSEG
jgi:hypothetical protein